MACLCDVWCNGVSGNVSGKVCNVDNTCTGRPYIYKILKPQSWSGYHIHWYMTKIELINCKAIFKDHRHLTTCLYVTQC